MNILLVNDDGYQAFGIQEVEKQLLELGYKVYVFAPLKVQSCKSGSITIGVPVKVKKVDEFHYIVDGSPIDCVKLGLYILKNKANISLDLIVSGCNKGLNLSYDIIYSGTINACVEALNNLVPCIAFSADENYTHLKEYFKDTFTFILDNKLLFKNKFISVNFPITNDIKGIQLTKLSFRKDIYYFDEIKVDEYLGKRTIIDEADEESDDYAIKHGYVSLTILNNSLFTLNTYKELKVKL